jgi:hypothetical protein
MKVPPTRALIHIDPMARDLKSQVDGLKRASLLFDEIHFRVARGWRLTEEAASDPNRYQRGPKGNLIPAKEFKPFVDGYNPLDDVIPGFALEIQSWKSELREIVEALIEAGIAKGVEDEEIKVVDSRNRIDHLRSLFVEADYTSEEFAYLSGNHVSSDFTFGRFEFASQPGGDVISELFYIELPPIFLDSIAITETLYLAHITSSNAVFLRPQYRPELDYRFRQFREGVKRLKEAAPDVAASLRMNGHFGEIAFNVSNSIVSSKLLSETSIDELLRFRAEMNDSRQRFISTDLAELDEMVSENAWSPTAKEEMRKYIETKLTSDIIAFNDKSKEVWSALFGSTGVRLAKVTGASILGGAAGEATGGLLGSVMPNATGMSLLLVSALVGLRKEAPGFFKDLEAAITEARKVKRSSIAYVSRLSKLG